MMPSDTAAGDGDVRIAIAELIRERGAVPKGNELAERLALPRTAIDGSLARLAAGRALILRPGASEIASFNPFAAGPTPFRVRSAGRDWWALCVWDALGIGFALGDDAVVSAMCGDDCGVPLELRVAGDAVGALDGVVLQFGLPALDWWKDILFT